MHLPSSSVMMPAHAVTTWGTKVAELGCITSHSIFQNSSGALCPWPHFTFPDEMEFQSTISPDGILLNTLPTSSMLAQNHLPIATNKEA
jgi:hypothetical protein